MRKTSALLISIILLASFLVINVNVESAAISLAGREDKIPVFVGFVDKPRIDIIRQYGGEVRVIFRSLMLFLQT